MPKTASRPLAVVILAAGKGKRMKSSLPKVLHPVCGKPALWHVLSAASALKPAKIVVVVNHERDHIEEQVASWGFKPEPVFVDQGKPLGTGHAVLVAEPELSRVEDVLVMAGDEPLHDATTLRTLMRQHRRMEAAATLLTTTLPDARGYGRIIRDGATFERIAEEKDASGKERDIREVATLVYAFRRPALFAVLPLVGTENKQKEYYLPDTLAILRDKGEVVGVLETDLGGALGINSPSELQHASEVMRSRINRKHLKNGVRIIDPAQTYLDTQVKIGAGTTLMPQTILEGDTRIGVNCEIGPGSRIRDTRIGDGSTVTYSVVIGAKLGKDVTVGPFTHIRPGTELADGAKAGSFTEIKASKVGKGSKVPHLSYVGDATLGANVNIGAGTVTVNYDGYEKHATVIGDDARVGSDSMLVAPVRLGKGAVTGAGSVISKNVAPGALAVERTEQRSVKGYRARKDAEAASKKAKGSTAKKKSKKRKA